MSSSRADPRPMRNGERCDAAARKRRGAWRTLELLALAAVAGVAYGVASSPWLRIERVTVRSADVDVAREAASAMRIAPDATLLTARLGKLRQQIEACPRVKDVVVRRRWRHELDVLVMPRRPVVGLMAGADCLLADEEGVCLRRVKEKPADLPLVRGLALDGIGPGDIVSRAGMATAWQCIRWGEKLPALGRISVDVSIPQRVCVWSGDGTKGIIGRPADLGRKLACFAATLQYLQERGWRARYVDVQDVKVGAIWRPAPNSHAPPSSRGV